MKNWGVSVCEMKFKPAGGKAAVYLYIHCTYVSLDLAAPEMMLTVSKEEERWRSGGMARYFFEARGFGGGGGMCHGALWPNVPK